MNETVIFVRYKWHSLKMVTVMYLWFYFTWKM